MSDPSDDEIEITEAELARATREFNIVYGECLAEWSRLEGELFYWFRALTKMDEKIARAVFFSARSFNGRADMLKAALDAANPDAGLADFLGAALKKAWGYSGLRNAATHGEPHMNLQEGSATAKQLVIIQGKKMSHEAEATMITMLDLMTSSMNFRRLRGYMFATHPDGPIIGSSLETHRQLILELPHQPHSTDSPEVDRNSPKPKPPPRS